MMLPIMLEQDFLTGRAIRPVELKIWSNSNILFTLLWPNGNIQVDDW